MVLPPGPFVQNRPPEWRKPAENRKKRKNAKKDFTPSHYYGNILKYHGDLNWIQEDTDMNTKKLGALALALLLTLVI